MKKKISFLLFFFIFCVRFARPCFSLALYLTSPCPRPPALHPASSTLFKTSLDPRSHVWASVRDGEKKRGRGRGRTEEKKNKWHRYAELPRRRFTNLDLDLKFKKKTGSHVSDNDPERIARPRPPPPRATCPPACLRRLTGRRCWLRTR